MKNKHLLNLILVAICIMTLAVLAYVFNFWSQKISNDTGDWGAFSDYLNPFVSFLNLIILGWLSFVVFKYNSNRDKQNDFFHQFAYYQLFFPKV